MKRLPAALIMVALALTSASALAAPGLASAECHDYPFTPLKHTVTHKELMQELSELESVGFQPSANDNDYPRNLEVAEADLHKEFRQDCMPAKVTEVPGGSTVN